MAKRKVKGSTVLGSFCAGAERCPRRKRRVPPPGPDGAGAPALSLCVPPPPEPPGNRRV